MWQNRQRLEWRECTRMRIIGKTTPTKIVVSIADGGPQLTIVCPMTCSVSIKNMRIKHVRGAPAAAIRTEERMLAFELAAKEMRLARFEK